MSKYTYSIQNNTANGVIDNDKLSNEIRSSSITVAFDFVFTDGDILDIYFKSDLSVDEQTTLSGLVSLHDGIAENNDELIKSTEGAIAVSLNYGELQENPLWVGGKFTATAGVVTFFDFEITELIKLISGKTFVSNIEDVHLNDYLEISMIDKNDVLEMFSIYGLTSGVDIIELKKFVKTLYVREKTFAFDNVYGAKFNLKTGLFVRFAYNSYGDTDINIAVQVFGAV